MTTLVLLHGAFRGGWSWERVVPLLATEGIDARAPDLLGAGARYRPGMPPYGVDDVAEDLAGWFAREGLRDVIVAGHSQGGFLARVSAARLAGRVAGLAYLDAPVPRDGEAARDLMPGAAIALDPAVEPDPGAWVDPPPGADPRCTPVPVRLSLEPVAVAGVAASLPERYAFCARTPDGYPSQTTRARLDAAGVAYEVLACGHDAPAEAPDLVAAWLASVVEGA